MSDIEQQLVELFRRLGAADQATLLSFAEFMGSKNSNAVPMPEVPVEVPAPETIERPEEESVVASLKRLAKTYPMLDKSKLLNATSDLVTAHIMKGRDVVDVIDELEGIFASQYDELKSQEQD